MEAQSPRESHHLRLSLFLQQVARLTIKPSYPTPQVTSDLTACCLLTRACKTTVFTHSTPLAASNHRPTRPQRSITSPTTQPVRTSTRLAPCHNQPKASTQLASLPLQGPPALPDRPKEAPISTKSWKNCKV